MKNCFQEGPIRSEFIGNVILKHQNRTSIGAHEIFLGQVRADLIGNQTVRSIDYSAHEEMANKVFEQIRQQAFEAFQLECLHIYHSLGEVAAGEICLFVMVSSPHRLVARQAMEQVVEEIKAKAPVFGKEIFTDELYQWKVNK